MSADDRQRFSRLLSSADLVVDEAARTALRSARPSGRADLARHPSVRLDRRLPPPLVVDVGRRRSDRMFTAGPVSFADLSRLLGALAPRDPRDGTSRPYPSAGGIYPVEVYVQVSGAGVEGLPAGAYYHDVAEGRLQLLQAEPAVSTADHFPTNREWVDGGTFAVLLVADLSAIRPLYGALARDFCLQEAGAMTQLVQEVASGLDLGVCQSGVVDASRAASLWGASDHELMAVLVGGRVDRRLSGLPVVPSSEVRDLRPRFRHASEVVLETRPDLVPPKPPPAAVPVDPVILPPPDPATEREVLGVWQALMAGEPLEPTATFFDVGATSLMAARAVRTLQEQFPDAQLEVADVFAFPSVRELARRIAAGPAPAALRTPSPDDPSHGDGRATPSSAALLERSRPAMEAPAGPVAIVGLAVKVAGAASPDAFWDLLAAGRCMVGPVPADRTALLPAFRPDTRQQFVASYLPEIEQFDPAFFHMSPREAERTDPAQRLFLETVTEALASAGALGGTLRGTRTGVYVGASRGDYADLAGADANDLTRVLPGNMGAIIANRVSHYFDFSGPSVVVDTACSSSLVALDQAVRALQSGDVDAAIAGGVNVLISTRPFEAFRQDGMESISGRCRTFDAGADGFVRGEGAAAVVLKRHVDAVRDGDHVMALVRGSASNHDGRTNSLPVPSPVAQRDVIERAHRRAGTRPAEIGYVEAHGTGTKLGDPIEIRGLTDAYRGDSGANAACAIGSVKSNLGHLEFAAGIVGVVKAVLVLEHGALPPSLHFVEPNPHIDFAASPFWVVDRLRPWPASAEPRRAAVSSFGVGGTNAHVVLEQAPATDRPASARSEWPLLVALSAVDEIALAAMVDDVMVHLAAHPQLSVGAMAHTLNTGRPLLPCRLAVVARDREQLLDRLALGAAARAATRGGGVFVHTVATGDDRPEPPPELRRRIDALDEPARLIVDRVVVDDRRRAPAGAPLAAASAELLALIGELWTLGTACDLGVLSADRRKVPVPGMRYRRQRCWWPAAAASPRDRSAPPVAISTSAVVPTPALTARADLLHFLQQQVAQSLGKPPDTVDPRTPLVEMGVDSLAAADLMTAVRDATGLHEDTSFFFEHPTLARLADALMARGVTDLAAVPAATVPVVTPRTSPDHDRAIAIVGMAARLPGADSLEAFWDNLRHGRHAITDVPRARFDIEAIFNPDRHSRRGSYGRWGGFLDDIDQFDARFFRIAEREARTMDPQHRLLLLTAWHALEDAGLAGAIAGSRTGVYVGASYTHHRDRMVQDGHQVDDAHEVLDNHNAVLANRVSYFLDLHGPCLTIDTLCSSSLVGLDAAVQALRRGEIDRAIVAGVHVALSPGYYEAVSRLGALSPDGRCRAFDAAANGYVPGEGVVVVVLEPLAAAQRQRRHVHALVRGTAVNHGGQSGGLTVPNPAAQAAVIRQAIADAGIDGATITYLEAHGTGTALGDPVEMRGIAAALDGGAPRQRCGLGSLKSNIGHLEPAAGLAGVVKVALALQHRQLPPTLHLHEPQPAIAFEDGPCYLVDRLRPWRSVTPLRAGVSSFGLGGTNAHAVLEEAPLPLSSAPPAGPWLFALSAKSDAALMILVEQMRAFLAATGPLPAIADICRSATEGRAHFPRRIACVVDGVPALAQQLARVAGELAGGVPCAPPADAGAAARAARAFLRGEEIDVAAAFSGAGFVRLPLYPFGVKATAADAVPGGVESTGHPFAEVVEPLDGAAGFLVHLDGEGTA